MEARVLGTITDKMASLHYETMEWLKEAQFYLDEIRVFQHLIHSKQLPNHVGEQISRDVDLNLSTMADKIHKDVLRRLKDHESYLHSLEKSEITMAAQEYDAKHTALASLVRNLKIAVYNLKAQVHKFMLQKEFGLRTSRM